MALLDAVEAFVERHDPLLQSYFVVRQQYRHVQACAARVLKRSSGPERRFVLFGRGRSGTTALVSMLDAHPEVRCEGEILRNYVLFPHAHVLGRGDRSSSDVYGCKILSYQLRDVQTRLSRPKLFLRRLHQRGWQVLYLRRQNLLRHALSNIQARRYEFHQKKSDDSSQTRSIRVDPEHVTDWMRKSEALREFEEAALRDVPHLSLTYEQHIQQQRQHQATVDRICNYLGIPTAAVESTYRKVSPPSLRDRVENYDTLVQYLSGTEYESYLD